jgi:hypothetical protein
MNSLEDQNLDAVLTHQVYEGVVLLPGAPHPDHVVEQKLVAIRGGEALVGDVRPVDDHGLERSDLGVDAEGGCGGGAHGLGSFQTRLFSRWS